MRFSRILIFFWHTNLSILSHFWDKQSLLRDWHRKRAQQKLNLYSELRGWNPSTWWNIMIILALRFCGLNQTASSIDFFTLLSSPYFWKCVYLSYFGLYESKGWITVHAILTPGSQWGDCLYDWWLKFFSFYALNY